MRACEKDIEKCQMICNPTVENISWTLENPLKSFLQQI